MAIFASCAKREEFSTSNGLTDRPPIAKSMAFGILINFTSRVAMLAVTVPVDFSFTEYHLCQSEGIIGMCTCTLNGVIAFQCNQQSDQEHIYRPQKVFCAHNS
ncbi:uncharacterized protein PHALS_01410 [Plasmopara halstedii]|uniref:Uncharacterized protein n=1 Tax=Plasmopara halstedii TaxID=4781 RepID=A0A0P1AWN2_PLAHL|nr:uncharacterized protein PHALS_01410 [Plasmopara halstedii]CEG45085.1 hypothetical protein PHALS_01410 [Plasmopara halstedii]|eukprot:XP_024581454.1 hypothetical protein PHALS_01410 [Plasmopara halstedii]